MHVIDWRSMKYVISLVLVTFIFPIWTLLTNRQDANYCKNIVIYLSTSSWQSLHDFQKTITYKAKTTPYWRSGYLKSLHYGNFAPVLTCSKEPLAFYFSYNEFCAIIACFVNDTKMETNYKTCKTQTLIYLIFFKLSSKKCCFSETIFSGRKRLECRILTLWTPELLGALSGSHTLCSKTLAEHFRVPYV